MTSFHLRAWKPLPCRVTSFNLQPALFFFLLWFFLFFLFFLPFLLPCLFWPWPCLTLLPLFLLFFPGKHSDSSKRHFKAFSRSSNSCLLYLNIINPDQISLHCLKYFRTFYKSFLFWASCILEETSCWQSVGIATCSSWRVVIWYRGVVGCDAPRPGFLHPHE